MFGWIKRGIRARYEGRLMPWWLRWALPAERPLLLLVGRRGKGKSAIATKIAQGRMRAGEQVYANYEIADREGNVAGRIYSLNQCLDLRDCTIIIDEANLWVSARQWQKIPAQVISTWAQSRKAGVSFIFTAQHEERVDKIIRELCDYVFVCERVPFVPRWVPLFRVQRTYLEEINEVRRGKLSRAEYYWLGDEVLGGYDTREMLDPMQLEALKEYAAAVARGDDPDELGIQVPDRREPVWVSRGNEIPSVLVDPE